MNFHLLHAIQRQFGHFPRSSVEIGPYVTRNVQGKTARVSDAGASDSTRACGRPIADRRI